MMKNLTFSERRYLIIKHLKRGLTYKEACEQVEKEYAEIAKVNNKVRGDNRRKKVVTKEQFMDGLLNPTNAKVKKVPVVALKC